MSFETYYPVWCDYEKGKTIRPKKAGATFTFDLTPEADKRYRLFTVGTSAQSNLWKDEPNGPYQYSLLNDSLDTDHAVNGYYALSFCEEEPRPFIRRAYKKILFPVILGHHHVPEAPDDWQTGLSVCAKDLVIDKAAGGYLRMRVEIRYKKPNVPRRDVFSPADRTVILDIPEGTYEMTDLAECLAPADAPVASVAFFVEGRFYTGEVYVECPHLTVDGFNLLPDFTPPVPDKTHFAWIGQHFSRKEWHKMRLALNGTVFFEGEIFERSHVNDEWGVMIPTELLKEHNTLTYELLSDYHDPVPYRFHELALAISDGGAVAVVAASDAAKVGGDAYILVRTDRENAEVTLDLPDGYFKADKIYRFAEAGLHGIRLTCLRAGAALPVSVTCRDVTRRAVIGRVTEGEDDGILTGTGDMVYIGQTVDQVENYLAWYLSCHVGNYLTIRPVYRWNGDRYVNPEAWALFTRVMNECGIRYIHIIDGREPCGLLINPTAEMLAGEGFMGQQTHEYDGAAFYWGNMETTGSRFTEMFCEMHTMNYLDGSAYCWPRLKPDAYLHHVGDRTYRYRDPRVKRDMKEGATRGVEVLRSFRDREVYHTGPSMTFKYLMQAGYPRVGIETAYNSMELQQAFLRGVADAYGFKPHGVHHAIQWASAPHDAPEHSRRFRLFLYVSYMQGATDINTEEGLWHMEEDYVHFHRFSEACRQHTAEQRDFHRYIASHTRRGKFYTPMALIHGRYDGWLGWRRESVWGWHTAHGADYPVGYATDAERSWDLLKVFYPLSRPGESIYRHPCPTNKPQGYFTGTPLGSVDTIPVEHARYEEIPYRTLAFMGYNCAEGDDLAKIADYVRRGGTLIATRAHLTDTTSLEDVRAYRMNYPATPLSFVSGEPTFAEDTVNGEKLLVCTNAEAGEVLARTDSGLPLVVKYALGEGHVVLFNTAAYPAHPAIRSLYEKMLSTAMVALTDEEPVWVEDVANDVQFTVYDTENGERHLYLIAADWYRDPAVIRRATIRVGEHRYGVELPFGVMIKCVTRGNALAYPHTEDGEVLSIDGDTVRVQGVGRVTFTLAKDGTQKTIEIDFSKSPVQTVKM